MQVVGVKFKGSKVYSFEPNGFDLKIKDRVVVETANGLEIGTVNKELYETDDGILETPLKSVIRMATNDDIAISEKNDVLAKTYKKDILSLVKKYKLEMKVVSIESSFDLSKLTVNFTSTQRVDFRDLVKELASKYRTRIELRQIGARDEVKCLGGLGPCGRECCCSKALDGFEHVTIKMAKMQGLSLNPENISGLCGRLMCCLAYENPHYSETYKMMPKIGMEVKTKDGKGFVLYNDLLKRSSTVKVFNGDASEIKVYKISELEFEKRD